MTTQEYKAYRNPASVSCFYVTQPPCFTAHWGYGLADMLTREKTTIPKLGSIKRVIATTEEVTHLPTSNVPYNVKCWGLVELEDRRIIEIEARVTKSILDPSLSVVVETGKPNKGAKK